MYCHRIEHHRLHVLHHTASQYYPPQIDRLSAPLLAPLNLILCSSAPYSTPNLGKEEKMNLITALISLDLLIGS